MDKNPLLSKGLVVGIILLFIGTCIIPTSAQDIEKPSLPTSSGNWLYVGGSGPGNYSKIQDAIDNATDGDVVFVYDDSSPYHENLVIPQTSLTLTGENKQTTVLLCNEHESDRAIIVGGDFVRISGFTIKEEEFSYLYFSIGSSHVMVTDNIIIGLELVLPVQTSKCKISNNIIKGNHSTAGIHVWGNYNIISDNLITECGTGIFIGYGGDSLHVRTFGNIITRNNILNNEHHATFDTAWCTYWMSNYWDDFQGIGPYEIRGKIIFLRGEDEPPWIFEWKNYDRHPVQEPYDIPGIS